MIRNPYEPMRYQLYTNTPLSTKRQYFVVTDENHPLFGKCYGITNFSKSFGVTLVHYTDDEGLEKTINTTFTSLNIINPFAVINKGRCSFLFTDMVDLSLEIEHLKKRLGVN
jgi:hypothetical protein